MPAKKKLKATHPYLLLTYGARALTQAEITTASNMAARGDYEVAHLLRGYVQLALDPQGLEWLREEITYAMGLTPANP